MTDEMSSFEEAVSALFDDSGWSLELEQGRTVFDPDVDANLRVLRDVAAAHRPGSAS